MQTSYEQQSAASKLNYLPWIVGIGLLMENIDTTIINTAIPQIAKALNVFPLNLKLGITSYLLALAIFIPISGYMADKYGTKRIFLIAMFVFLIGSALCGFSHNLTMLIIGRLIQGLGGSMMTPTGRLILIKSFPKSDLVRIFSYITFVGQFGPAIGPVLGGVLTTYANWRWIFFANIPIGIIALILITRYVENAYQEDKRPFDAVGFILFGIAASLITFCLTLLTEREFFSKLEFIGLGAGFIFAIIFFLHAKKTRYPSLDVNLLKINTFRIAVIGSLIMRIGIGGIPFFLPLLFQLVFNLNAFESGLLTLPYGIAMLTAKPFVRKLLKRYGFKNLLILNPLLIGLALLILSFINYASSWIWIACIVFTIGFFCSLQFTYMNVLNFVDIENKDTSKATSLSSVLQQLAMSFGVCAAGGSLLLFSMVLPSGVLTLAAFKSTILVLSIISISSIIMFAQLAKDAGAAIL